VTIICKCRQECAVSEIKKNEPLKVVCTHCKNKIVIDDNSNLTNLVIPENIKTIGKDAFSGNNLTNITLPDNFDSEMLLLSPLIYDKYVKNGKKKATFNIRFISTNAKQMVLNPTANKSPGTFPLTRR